MRKVNGILHEQAEAVIRFDPGDQAAVDFDDLRRIAQQIDDIGVSCSVIVNGDHGLSAGLADALEPCKLLVGRGAVLQQFKDKVFQIILIPFRQLCAVLLAEQIAGDRVEKYLSAAEIGIVLHIPRNDPEDGHFVDLVQLPGLPCNGQDLQRVQPDRRLCPHQGFIGIDRRRTDVYDRLEIEAEEILFHQLCEGTVQPGDILLFPDLLSGRGRAQTVQIHFTQRQMNQVFQQDAVPAGSQFGIAVIHFEQPGTDLFRVICRNIPEERVCGMPDPGFKCRFAVHRINNGKLVFRDACDLFGAGVRVAERVADCADDFLCERHAAVFVAGGIIRNAVYGQRENAVMMCRNCRIRVIPAGKSLQIQQSGYHIRIQIVFLSCFKLPLPDSSELDGCKQVQNIRKPLNQPEICVQVCRVRGKVSADAIPRMNNIQNSDADFR